MSAPARRRPSGKSTIHPSVNRPPASAASLYAIAAGGADKVTSRSGMRVRASNQIKEMRMKGVESNQGILEPLWPKRRGRGGEEREPPRENEGRARSGA